jgi:hypothetical protein
MAVDLKVYERSVARDHKFLTLRTDSNGDIDVRVVDAAGRPIAGGILVSFLPSGRIRLETGVDPDLGFELDVDGAIQVAP